ncbi:MAG: Lrp/AsnC family transcriptional regulator [Rhizomicrobium sp.]
MHEGLDATDLKLLGLMQEDAALSVADLAEKVGMSQSPCWRRVQRLKDEGYITRQVTLLDRRKLGLNTQVFARIKLSAHGRANLTDFSKAVAAFSEVMECYVLMGGDDFLLRIVTKDVEAYERFFYDRLSQLPGVQEINSAIALSDVKATTALPLEPLAVEKPRRKGAGKNEHRE